MMHDDDDDDDYSGSEDDDDDDADAYATLLSISRISVSLYTRTWHPSV